MTVYSGADSTQWDTLSPARQWSGVEEVYDQQSSDHCQTAVRGVVEREKHRGVATGRKIITGH